VKNGLSTRSSVAEFGRQQFDELPVGVADHDRGARMGLGQSVSTELHDSLHCRVEVGDRHGDVGQTGLGQGPGPDGEQPVRVEGEQFEHQPVADEVGRL
jgi:hypothetical protein